MLRVLDIVKSNIEQKRGIVASRRQNTHVGRHPQHTNHWRRQIQAGRHKQAIWTVSGGLLCE